MNVRHIALACALLSATFADAGRRKISVTVDWAQNDDESRIAFEFVKRGVLGYREAGHPIEMKATLRKRGRLPDIHVWDAYGKEVYSGDDKNDAVEAIAEAIMDLPVPGQLINGVELKKFRNYDQRYVMGKVRGEGADLAPFKAALKSKNLGEAVEAQAILDSIAKAKKNLEEDIAACLAEGTKEAKGEALRDIVWFRQTWPSERDKYAEQYKTLLADSEAKAEAAALLKAAKKRK